MTHSELQERIGSEVAEILGDLSGSLLQRIHASPSTELLEPLPEGVRSVQTHAKSFGESLKFHMYHVASDYYDWTLEKRVLTLKAPTIDHLCKSILFENTRYTLLDESSDPLDPANSRFYLVVVQYTDKINSQKLNNYVQHELGGGKLGRKKYNFRLAPEDSAAELTGFIRNGVSPFGLKSKIPIIVTENITKLQPHIVYFGAGHPEYKIMCPITEFLSVTNAMVTDLA